MKERKTQVNVRLPKELIEYCLALGFGEITQGMIRALEEHKASNLNPSQKEAKGEDKKS